MLWYFCWKKGELTKLQFFPISGEWEREQKIKRRLFAMHTISVYYIRVKNKNPVPGNYHISLY